MKKIFLTALASFLIIGFSSQIAMAQQTKQSPEMLVAGKFIQEKKWSEAENSFATIVLSDPQNARAWFLLGVARHSQAKWKSAIEAFEKNVEISKNPIGMYNIAAGFSRLKQNDKAFAWLEKSINSGAWTRVNIKKDTDFENIKTDKRFKDMVLLIDKKRKPCMYSKESRQFDFWIGHWDVFVNGRKVGENKVERELFGCTLVENWRNNGGGTGKSLNSYNFTKKKWKQFYVDSTQSMLEFEGEFKDKIMRLKGETINAKGVKIMHILEFHDLPDGTVRQKWDQSTDDGKTWNTVWDSIYKRKTKKAK